MSTPALDRSVVVELLRPLAHRAGDPEADRLDSMEVAWLVHQVEQRYQVIIDLDDDQLARMHTIDDAVVLLGESVAASA